MQDVEPISADILHTVDMAVVPRVAAPGPKNSRILPLPPETVRIPARLRMMSVGLSQCRGEKVDWESARTHPSYSSTH